MSTTVEQRNLARKYALDHRVELGERGINMIAALIGEAADLRADLAAARAELAAVTERAERLTRDVDVAIAAGRNDVLRFLREQAKLVPLGAEDVHRGASVYNWHMDAIARVEHWLEAIAARAAALAGRLP